MAHEHLLIFVNGERTEHLWQPGPLTSHRANYPARRYFASQLTEGAMQVLRSLRFSLEEEAGLTFTEVVARVERAFFDGRRAFYLQSQPELEDAELAAGLHSERERKSIWNYRDVIIQPELSDEDAARLLLLLPPGQHSRNAVAAQRRPYHLDTVHSPANRAVRQGRGTVVFADLLPGSRPEPDEVAQNRILAGIVSSVLETLTDRERSVLQLRFGLLDDRSRTLEEVGRRFGVTRERIRQIEAKALRRLRHPSRSRRLQGFVGDESRESGRPFAVPGWNRVLGGALWITPDFYERRSPSAHLLPPAADAYLPFWDAVSPRNSAPTRRKPALPRHGRDQEWQARVNVEKELRERIARDDQALVSAEAATGAAADFIVGAEEDFVIGAEEDLTIGDDAREEPEEAPPPSAVNFVAPHQTPLELPGALPLFDLAVRGVGAADISAEAEPPDPTGPVQAALFDVAPLATADVSAVPLAHMLAGLVAEGFTVVDNRPKGGSVWVLDPAQKLRSRIRELAPPGVVFHYARRQGRNPSGWWTK